MRSQGTFKGYRAQRQNIVADRRCKRIFALLSDYLDGALSIRDCRELERHLEGCKPCIAFLESLKTTVEACHRYGQTEMPSPRPEMTPEVRAGLLKSFRAGPVRTKVPTRRRLRQSRQKSKHSSTK